MTTPVTVPVRIPSPYYKPKRRNFVPPVTPRRVDRRVQTVRSDLNNRERDRQSEPPGPCASGIHETHSSDGIHSRSVRVPGDDDVDTGTGIDAQRLEVMKHVEGP